MIGNVHRKLKKNAPTKAALQLEDDSSTSEEDTNPNFTAKPDEPGPSQLLTTEKDPDFISHRSQLISKPRSQMKLSVFSRKCDRRCVSDRAAADLASALLHDVSEHVQAEDRSASVIDRYKVRREKIKTRQTIQYEVYTTGHKIVAFFLDGRSDETLAITQMDDGKWRKRKVWEEHITLVEEPGSVYLGHFAPKSKSAKDISDGIFSLLNEKAFDLSELAFIGSDGKMTNTGVNAGVIRRLEEKLNSPVHWTICQLHFNELPLRHFTEAVDGKTSGPSGFRGLIGKCLKTCENLPIVNFQKTE